MNANEIRNVLERSMHDRKKVAINYKDGESHFGWIKEPSDTLAPAMVLMIDGVMPHTVDIENVESIEVTNEYF